MIIKMDSARNLQTSPNTVKQGASITDVVIIIPNGYASSVSLRYVVPNGTASATAIASLCYLDNSPIYKVSLPNSVTNRAGTLRYELIITDSNGNTTISETGSINIQRGLMDLMPSSVEQLSNYTINQLYTLLTQVNASYGYILDTICEDYDPTCSYIPDMYVKYNGTYYKCIADTVPGAFDPSKWSTDFSVLVDLFFKQSSHIDAIVIDGVTCDSVVSAITRLKDCKQPKEFSITIDGTAYTTIEGAISGMATNKQSKTISVTIDGTTYTSIPSALTALDAYIFKINYNGAIACDGMGISILRPVAYSGSVYRTIHGKTSAQMKIGTSIFIRDFGVPDLWISAIDDTATPSATVIVLDDTTTDATITTALKNTLYSVYAPTSDGKYARLNEYEGEKVNVPIPAIYAPPKVASASAVGSATNYAKSDHTHGVDVSTGDNDGEVKVAGQNAKVNGWNDVQKQTLEDPESQYCGNTVEEAVTSMADNITDNTNDIDDLQTDLATAQTDLANAQSEIDTLKRKVANLEGNCLTTENGTSPAYVQSVKGKGKYAFPKTISGKSVKWNQQIKYTAQGYGVVTNNGDGSFTIDGTIADTDYFLLNNDANGKQSTKWYVTTNNADTRIKISNDGNGIITNDGINTTTNNFTSFYLRMDAGTYSNVVVKPRATDLTSAFGSGNEPTSLTDERILAIKSRLQAHPEYNAGEILHAKCDKMVSVGANLWDEEWEVGNYNSTTGAKDVATDRIRNKNYIPCSPNTTYYFRLPTSYAKLYGYDKNHNFIGYFGAVNAQGNTFTTPSNCYYINFELNSPYGTTYNHDICINLSNASFNGKYKPHIASIDYPINANIQSLSGYGWSAGSVANTLDLNNKKFVKRVGLIDLSTLTYRISNNNKVVATLSDFKPVPNTEVANLIVASFETVKYSTTSSSTSNYEICCSNNTNEIAIYIQGAFEGKTQQQIQEMFSGKYAYYELANPTETDVSAYITGNGTIQIEEGGSVVFHQQDSLQFPMANEIVYQVHL